MDYFADYLIQWVWVNFFFFFSVEWTTSTTYFVKALFQVDLSRVPKFCFDRFCLTFLGFRKCLACGIEGNDLEKCQHDECGEYYHAACLAGPKSSNAKLRICPKHKCYTCKLQRREPKGAKHKLSACNRCPVAYHFNFMCFPAEAQICVDNSKYMTCWRHIKDLEARPAKSKQRKKAKGGTRARGIKTDVCFYCLDGTCQHFLIIRGLTMTHFFIYSIFRVV